MPNSKGKLFKNFNKSWCLLFRNQTKLLIFYLNFKIYQKDAQYTLGIKEKNAFINFTNKIFKFLYSTTFIQNFLSIKGFNK